MASNSQTEQFKEQEPHKEKNKGGDSDHQDAGSKEVNNASKLEGATNQPKSRTRGKRGGKKATKAAEAVEATDNDQRLDEDHQPQEKGADGPGSSKAGGGGGRKSGHRKGAYSALKNRMQQQTASQQYQAYQADLQKYQQRLTAQHSQLSVEQQLLMQQYQLRQMYYQQQQQQHQQYGQQQQQPGMQQFSSPQQGHPGAASDNRQGSSHKKKKKQQKAPPKKIFEDYWDKEKVQQGLKRGELIEGALRINPKNYNDAYIPHPDGMSDIYISGMADRNRALNTDVVAVLLYPREDWKVHMENINHHRGEDLSDLFTDLNLDQEESDGASDKCTQQASDCDTKDNCDSQSTIPKATTPQPSRDNDQTGNARQQAGGSKPGSNTPQKKYTSLRDLCSQEAPGLSNERVRRRLQVAEHGGADQQRRRNMDSVRDSLLLRTGKVVYIVEKKHSRACTGNLKPMPDGNKQVALFSPFDHRLPRLHIPMESCPANFSERPQDYASTLFVARITDWKDCYMNAHGMLARSLGEAGEIEPETEGILMEHGVDSSDFPQPAIDCLPQVSDDNPWQIPEHEFTYRRDFRKECVFTIDPATARDLDDALHCNHLGDGVYEVGVHIADVSYFVTPDNALDTVAADRATSVYLVQKVIPMLPRLLCEQLCSLNPDCDRLTFSVVWRIKETGEIEDEWFGRSVICSCVKLSYEHAQGFIEQPQRAWTQAELPPISTGFTVPHITQRVLNLHKIAQNLRRHRFENGALRLDQVKLSYSLDKDTGMPNGYYVYQQRDSNKLVEEFMLLANMASAHRIYKSFPELAVLRRHPEPQSKMVQDLEKTCAGLGVAMDAHSSHSIARSIEAVAGPGVDALARAQILTVLCSKPMQLARYFCTGCLADQDLYRHYALNVPLYTHFTSPIRRYPDIMVHRLLAASLDYTAVPGLSKGEVMKQCDHCNDKKMASKMVQDLSSEMFFAVFVKECGPLEEKGMVMGVLDKAFDVLVLKLGVVKRVYCEQLDLERFEHRVVGKRAELTLVWRPVEEGGAPTSQTISIFSTLHLTLSAADQPLKWKAVAKHPDETAAGEVLADAGDQQEEET